MRPFNNLLVYPASARVSAAVNYAARFAANGGVRVTLVDTVEQLPEEVQRRLPAELNVLQMLRNQKKADLRRTTSRLRRAGTPPRVVTLETASPDALVLAMAEGAHDLLVVDAARDPVTNNSRHNIARLVHNSPRRLLLARKPVREHPRILVTVDVSPWRTRENDELTVLLLETAISLAEQLSGEIHVLHAWESIGDGSMRWAGVADESSTDHENAVRREAREELEQFLEPYREHVDESNVHLESGDPRKVIPAFAAQKRIDLIVIGTVARSGLSGRIIGNTAEAVLDDVPCSMLVVRRDRPQLHRHETVASAHHSGDAS